MRIVSLLPSATEIVAALGLADHLVGVTHECDYPPSVRALPKVTRTHIPADASSAEIDRLVRERLNSDNALYTLDSAVLEKLGPDLIVTQALCDVCAVAEDEVRDAACRLPGSPRVVNLEPMTLAGVFDAMRRVARAAAEVSGRRMVERKRPGLRSAIARTKEDAPTPAPDRSSETSDATSRAAFNAEEKWSGEEKRAGALDFSKMFARFGRAKGPRILSPARRAGNARKNPTSLFFAGQRSALIRKRLSRTALNNAPDPFSGPDLIPPSERAAKLLQTADAAIAALRARVDAVADRSATLASRPRVAFLEWLDPPFSGGHWNPELVRLAGGRDVLGREAEPSRSLTWDEIRDAEPDVLFIACCGFDARRALQDVSNLASNPVWRDLPAVRSGRVPVADGSQYFNRPGPRLVDSLEILAHALHPGLHPLPPGLPSAIPFSEAPPGSP